MSEREWKPKVGDKVKVTGVLQMCDGNASAKIMEGAVWECKSPSEGMVRLWRLTERGPQDAWVHLRNLDPVLEDERRGAPRPAPVEGDAIDLVLPGRIVCREYATPPIHRLRAEVNSATLEIGDPRVRQIERRKQNLGREARKS